MFLGVFCYLSFSCLLSLCKTVNSSVFITHVLTSLDKNDALPSAKITNARLLNGKISGKFTLRNGVSAASKINKLLKCA